MKQRIILAGIMSLFVMAISVSAQKAPDFSGTWNLDLSRSKLGDRNNIESQTLTVTQTDKDITVTTATKRTPPPADAPQGGRPGGGMGRGGFGGGDGTTIYKLDGSEVKSDMQMGNGGSMTITTKAKIDAGKLSVTRTMTTPMGDRTSSESWEVSGDSNTLTVTSQRPNREGGTDTTTRVFAKKQ